MPLQSIPKASLIEYPQRIIGWLLLFSRWHGVFSGAILYDDGGSDDSGGGVMVMYVVRMFIAYRLDLKPNPGGTFEPGSEGDLHNAVSLLQRIVPLVVVNVFQLVPDRRGTGVSVVIQSHSGRLRVVLF